MGPTANLPGDFEEDDDDGIDWSEACREIDIVCEASGNFASTSSIPSEMPQRFSPGRGNAKQSTLDKFVVKSAPRLPSEIPQIRAQSKEKPSCLEIDPDAAKTWIYPVNISMREYQFNITKTALFSNTLVALPTGLGKTFIAAVVMYNYFRWFPYGKIVFAAPSRPLVVQQIEACHNIVGIPQEMTIDMTGLTIPAKRADLWKSKRVFFVTPQVLEKDLQSGICFAKHLVCLVIDEAHRALGNYASSVAVRELMGVPVCLRILALTATPGSKQQTIQQVIDNLRISTLEYREESDHDVIKYVHNRKLELIRVGVGQDAFGISEKISAVIRPYLKKLNGWRIHSNRDEKSLSPTELLLSRDKFRQACQNFSNFDKNSAEGYFGLLITLTHIRRLLLVHGISPAYEMLEERWNQGSFARYMSRNEYIIEAKLMMKQNLSNGAPSPKLSKMLEVLLDHFAKDPENSRVIIFSNFRQSVSDIMGALVKLGSCVRATEFIGQSSGKKLKGQSQKAQQAVLEKFRAGEFNVIVSTSIGEEGLDIMEVDLVICFDANVSPLRMIQRMGRTGRKNDGRVVVLACEGIEMKSYTRKLASSKSIEKHMRNGGVNSFTFHPSSRMVPHIYKPEVEYVEIAIEKFVRSGKNVKNDGTPVTLVLQGKLTDSESNLISKYFHPPGGITWKPSLIAFPHFQTVSSRVYNVNHSYKTGLLIDAMQQLQGLSFAGDSRTSLIEDGEDLWIDNVEHHENSEDFLHADDSPMLDSKGDLLDCEAPSPDQIAVTKKKDIAIDISAQSPIAHSYLFGSDFVSVDSFGNVIILSVPVISLKELSPSKNTSEHKVLNCVDQFSWHLEKVEDINGGQTIQSGAVQDQKTSHKKWQKYESPRYLCSSDAVKDKTTNSLESVPLTPSRRENLEYEDSASETLNDNINISLSDDEDGPDFGDIKLSHRLTYMIKSGVVPESPMANNGLSNGNERSIYQVPDPVSPAQLHSQVLFKSPVPIRNETSSVEIDSHERSLAGYAIKGASQTPVLLNDGSASIRGCTSVSPVADKSESPLVDLTNDSCSKNWQLSIGEKSESVKNTRKFKRLRKIGDFEENENLQRERGGSLVPGAKQSRRRGGKKQPINEVVRAFIDEEAEVSTDGDASEDEEDHQDNNSHDSFIDDRTCSTNPVTLSGNAPDMMAIYRRSLFTQSPMPRHPSPSTTTPSSHSSSDATARTSETESLHGKQSFSFRSPLKDPKQCFQMNRNSETVPCTSGASIHNGRKRKLSFCPSISLPAVNLEQEFQLLQHENCSMPCDDDDEFFEYIDCDAVEAQAALLLQQKAVTSTPQKKKEISVPLLPQSPGSDMPSFDLGID